jgi:hypothetical protein
MSPPVQGGWQSEGRNVFRPRSVLVQFVLGLLLHAPAGLAQTIGSTTGAVEGAVLDATGAVLPRVTVTVAGDPLLVPSETTSARDGSYRFPTLPPGRYVLTFAFPGFETEQREGILVSLGVTTTVDITLGVAARGDAVTVEGGAAVVDLYSTKISTVFDAGELARLPGNRTVAAILAAAPAVQLTRFDVGGSTAFAPGPWSAYGTPGYDFLMIEGIAVGGAPPPGLFLDYGSVTDVSVGTGAFGPEAPLPGVNVRFVTKSGGNRYAGSIHGGYENRAWQGHNIDANQAARGAPGAGGVPAREWNRLLGYHDASGDIGGYVLRDRLWWYASARDHGSSARQVSFPMAPIDNRVTSITGKATWRRQRRSPYRRVRAGRPPPAANQARRIPQPIHSGEQERRLYAAAVDHRASMESRVERHRRSSGIRRSARRPVRRGSRRTPERLVATNGRSVEPRGFGREPRLA